MKPICFVATTPFAVNAFLLGHLGALSDICEVTLCVNLDLYPLAHTLDSRVRVLDVPLARKISFFQDVRALLSLLGIFNRNKFLVVHSITPKAGLLAMLASFICRVPHRFHTFTGQVWATRTGVARTVLKSLDRAIVALSTRVFSDSKSQSRFLENEGVAGKGGVSMLGKGAIVGVDPVRFKPTPEIRQQIRQGLGVSDHCFVFLYVGRLAKDKGVFDLIEAFSTVLRKCPEIELWMVGPDEESLQDELRVLAGESEKKIRWIGPTLAPESYMASADVLVLASYREGFGMVIVEAAGCGIPSLAYRIDGVIDAIVDGETGILVPPRDRPKLASAMMFMLENPGKVKELGRNACTRVRCDFSSYSVTKAWLDFYKGFV